MAKTLTIMTAKELAAALRISHHTLLRLRAEGLIRSYRIRTMIRFVLEEVLDDLKRAEGELPLRRIAGTLHLSGGPREYRRSIERVTGNTITLEPFTVKEDDYEKERERRITAAANKKTPPSKRSHSRARARL